MEFVKSNNIGASVYPAILNNIQLITGYRNADIYYGIIVSDSKVLEGYTRVSWYNHENILMGTTLQKVGKLGVYDLIYKDVDIYEENRRNTENYHSAQKNKLNEPGNNNTSISNKLCSKITTIQRTEEFTGCSIQGRKRKSSIAKGHFGD